MDYNLKRKTVLIGSRIRQLRKEIGWTQHKLAKKLRSIATEKSTNSIRQQFRYGNREMHCPF